MPVALVLAAISIPSSTEIGGVRVNIWVSGAVFLAAVVVLVVRGRAGHPDDPAAGLDLAGERTGAPGVALGALSCQQVAGVLQSFLDREVDPDTIERIEDHLEQCRRCGMEAEVYREIKESLSRATPAVPELTLRRLRHFGEELGARVGGHPQGSGH